jgi:hypothetical protein
MDQQLIKSLLASAVRHGLTTLAGVLATHGYLSSSASEQFVSAGLLFAGVVWSWWQKDGQAKVLAALAKHRNVTPTVAAQQVKDAAK